MLAVEALPPDQVSSTSHSKLAQLLNMPKDQVPPVRLKWCHLSRSASGELQARCSKVPSDLEAGVGYHVDNHHPGEKERVFGYLHLKTTALHPDFALELPLGNSTYAAGADEGSEFLGHRSALAMPVLPGQIQLYTRLSATEVRRQLIAQKGYQDTQLPTPQTLNAKLNEMGYFHKKVAKSKPQKKFHKRMPSSIT